MITSIPLRTIENFYIGSWNPELGILLLLILLVLKEVLSAQIFKIREGRIAFMIRALDVVIYPFLIAFLFAVFYKLFILI